MSGENTGSIGKAKRQGRFFKSLSLIDIFVTKYSKNVPGPGSYFTFFTREIENEGFLLNPTISAQQSLKKSYSTAYKLYPDSSQAEERKPQDSLTNNKIKKLNTTVSVSDLKRKEVSYDTERNPHVNKSHRSSF